MKLALLLAMSLATPNAYSDGNDFYERCKGKDAYFAGYAAALSDVAEHMGQVNAVAQQERATITERTHSGRRQKALRGGIASGPAPLGYKLDQLGGIVEDEETAETVRRIFALRNGGATLQAIADELNGDGTPTARGGKWWPATVRYVLDNPTYRGQVEYLFSYGGRRCTSSSQGGMRR